MDRNRMGTAHAMLHGRSKANDRAMKRIVLVPGLRVLTMVVFSTDTSIARPTISVYMTLMQNAFPDSLLSYFPAYYYNLKRRGRRQKAELSAVRKGSSQPGGTHHSSRSECEPEPSFTASRPS